MESECCVCHKVRRGSDWICRPVNGVSDEPISHGYCPRCARQALQELHADRFYASEAACGASPGYIENRHRPAGNWSQPRANTND